MPSSPPPVQPHLVVDLDRTLIKTDLLWEQLLTIIRTRPFHLFILLLALSRGRLAFKKQVAVLAPVVPDHLLYRQAVLDLIQTSRAQGSTVGLASASLEPWVQAVANHLGCFDWALGSNEVNLKGAVKLAAIRDRLQNQPFAYIGDSPADLAIWAGSTEAVVVNGGPSLFNRLAQSGLPFTTINDTPPFWVSLLRQLRPHQWVKNLLLLVPVFTAHRLAQLPALIPSVTGAIAFSLTASAVYILNDLLDLPADRGHTRKRTRPLASGALTIPAAAALMLLLLSGAGALTAFLPPAFGELLAIYLGVNLLYSSRFKKALLIDVVILAALYTLRVLAGGAATALPISQWLLAFSTFLFFSLALLKRHVELGTITTRIAGRNYRRSDREAIFVLGAASALMSALIFVLYLNSPEVRSLYHNPSRLWLVTPILLYWHSRVWLLAHRDEVDSDPVLFALKDSGTWWVLTGLALLMWAAI